MVKLFSELYNLFQIGYNSFKINVCACIVCFNVLLPYMSLINRSFHSSIRSGASFIASGIVMLTRSSRLMNSIRNRASLHRSVPNGNSYQSSAENLIESVSNVCTCAKPYNYYILILSCHCRKIRMVSER